jgi:hypothetical protein
MTFEQFTAHISDNVQNRFSLKSYSDIEAEMLALLPEIVGDRQILRFYRQHSSDPLSHFMKTLLMVSITTDNLRDILQWAALCKEMLLDPETSDIISFYFVA